MVAHGEWRLSARDTPRHGRLCLRTFMSSPQGGAPGTWRVEARDLLGILTHRKTHSKDLSSPQGQEPRLRAGPGGSATSAGLHWTAMVTSRTTGAPISVAVVSPAQGRGKGKDRGPRTGRKDARGYRLSWEAVRGDSVLLLKMRRIPNPHDRLWRAPSRLLPWATTSTTATMLGWLKDVWKYTGYKRKSEAG